MRIVATLTTLPSRYSRLLTTLQSLHSSTVPLQAIYLTIPSHVTRLGQSYPPLPFEISDLCTVITSSQDYGPLTKMYGALTQESDPDTYILCCDDDMFYPPDLLSRLLHHRSPQTAIAGTGALLQYGVYGSALHTSLEPLTYVNNYLGFHLPPEGRSVDVLFGMSGVLYQRSHFPNVEELWTYAQGPLFYNDDLILSGYCQKYGIRRRIYPDIPPVRPLEGTAEDALSVKQWAMLQRMQEAWHQALKQGLFVETEQVAWTETYLGRLTVLALALIIIIIVVITITTLP